MDPTHNIVVADDAQHLAQMGAELLLKTARRHVARTGRCNIAVSGGSTPRRMHRLLAQAPYADVMPWMGLHLFWVDERLVTVDDPASNYGLALKDFLSRVALPQDNIHPMRAMTPPEAAAADYQRTLERHFEIDACGGPAFDLVFLGIGTDGHTASIFPRDTTAETPTLWVVAVKGGTPDVDRLTLTYRVLNCAGKIVFLVSGAPKASIVKRILTKEEASLPPLKLHPQGGEVLWLLDREAAGKLPPQGIPGDGLVLKRRLM